MIEGEKLSDFNWTPWEWRICDLSILVSIFIILCSFLNTSVILFIQGGFCSAIYIVLPSNSLAASTHTVCMVSWCPSVSLFSWNKYMYGLDHYFFGVFISTLKNKINDQCSILYRFVFPQYSVPVAHLFQVSLFSFGWHTSTAFSFCFQPLPLVSLLFLLLLLLCPFSLVPFSFLSPHMVT